jgi:hypothetical protein
MTRKRHLLLYYGFTYAIFTFFIILALSMRVLWISIILIIVFGSGIAIPIYWRYRYAHSGKEEKELMVAQKQINHYYYDRCYTPADSTEIDYQIARIKKRKSLCK